MEIASLASCQLRSYSERQWETYAAPHDIHTRSHGAQDYTFLAGLENGDLPESSLGAYVQAAHQEMLSQASLRLLQKCRLPVTVASLLVKKKGVITTTDIGGYRENHDLKLNLHPKTQALFSKIGAHPNRSNGYCSCIQAINSFYKMFPEDEVPEGSTMAIYGCRDSGGSRESRNRLLRPCRAIGGVGCSCILSAAGISRYVDLKNCAIPKHREKPSSEEISSKIARLHRASVSDPRTTYGPYVRTDRPIYP